MVDAYEVYHGLMPYRDFITYTPPGMLYLLAVLFKIFGPSMVLSRLLTTCLPKWLTVIVIFKIARRLTPSLLVAVVSGAFATLALGTSTFSGADYTGVQPAVLCTLGAMGGTFFLIEFIFTGCHKWIALSGLTTGVIFIFRYDIGLYSLLGHCASLVLARISIDPPGKPRFLLTTTLPIYGATVLAVVGPVVAYFILNVPRDNLILSFLEYPAAYLRSNVQLKFFRFFPNPVGAAAGQVNGSLRSILLAWILYDSFRLLLFATYAWAWVWLVNTWKRAGVLDLFGQGMAALILLGLFLYGYYIKSSNVFSVSAPVYVLLPVLTSAFWNSRSLAAAWTARLAAAWMAGLALFMWLAKPILPRSYHRLMDIPNARGLLVPAEEAVAIESLVKTIQLRVPAQEKIIVCDQYYDVRTPLMLYFLADRRPGTSIYDFYPGVTDREDIQKRIISDIVANRVRYIIQMDWPNNVPPAVANSTFLTAFVQARFKEIAHFGPYRLLQRTFRTSRVGYPRITADSQMGGRV